MKNDPEAISQILKAAKFAASKHKDQRRKDNVTPYINHPIAVAELISSVGRVHDIKVLLAALLHDTVEDTGTKPEELEREFGSEVAAIVMEVTDDKSLPKAERKRLQVEHSAHLSHSAKLIKLADKISNVRNVIESPPIGWDETRRREYVQWASSVVDQIRGTNERLEKLFDDVCASSQQAATATL